MTSLDARLLDRVAAATGSRVTGRRGLREGGSPWLLTLADGAEVVLRVGERDLIATEVTALRLLADRDLPVPRLLDADPDGEPPSVLTTRLPGTSRTTSAPSRSRLRALGAAAARVHAGPVPDLPLRPRPIASVDFAALRRAVAPRPLLAEAEAALAAAPPPDGPRVLVHGDLWHGNTLWDGDRLTGLVDWDCAGVGHPGVDVGSLRCDAVLFTGRPDAADDVLDGYGTLPDVARYDVEAALATPPDLGWFVAAAHDQGRADLDRGTLLARRDAFLRDALDRLAADVRAARSRAADSRAEDSRAEDSRAEDSRAEDSRAEDSRAEDSRAEDSRAADFRAAGSRAAGSQAT
jgi:aminoglycoside phosphotransferase